VQLINAFADAVSMTNGVALPDNVPGLLNPSASGSYTNLVKLGEGILSVLAETLYDSIKGTIEEKLTEVLSSAAPSLESITEVLLELRDVIEDVQTELQSTGSIAAEVSNTLNSPLVQDTANVISDEIMKWIHENLENSNSVFDEYTPEEMKAMLRQQITDAFYSSVPCADVQQIIRSQLYEVQSSIQEGIDSALEQLNKAMKDLVSEYLAGIDEEINGALGDLSDIMGAGQIDGYAHIRHDSLNELRLDGKFQWKVPDEMEFNAYLIIKDLNSSMPGGCVPGDADSLPEVTLGTTDIGLGMMGSDIRADISTKFAFAVSGSSVRLIGMGGSFDMTEGEIGFESFAIDDFYAAVAFGAMENYLSANIHCTFTSYEVEGGIFLGRTCTLDPFSWDPDVQGILGDPDPTLTGIYVYGEGWMPIVDYGCLFRVKAGVGAGIFAFAEGPIGGKIFLGADGEALCVINVSGEVTLVGVKDGDDMRMKGKGKISGRAGSCPFCVKFSKTVTISYDNGEWDADY
jgi:gas vesicle protein